MRQSLVSTNVLLCKWRQFLSLFSSFFSPSEKRETFLSPSPLPRFTNPLKVKQTLEIGLPRLNRRRLPASAIFRIKKTLRAFSVSNCVPPGGPGDGRGISFPVFIAMEINAESLMGTRFVFGLVFATLIERH